MWDDRSGESRPLRILWNAHVPDAENSPRDRTRKHRSRRRSSSVLHSSSPCAVTGLCVGIDDRSVYSSSSRDRYFTLSTHCLVSVVAHPRSSFLLLLSISSCACARSSCCYFSTIFIFLSIVLYYFGIFERWAPIVLCAQSVQSSPVLIEEFLPLFYPLRPNDYRFLALDRGLFVVFLSPSRAFVCFISMMIFDEVVFFFICFCTSFQL